MIEDSCIVEYRGWEISIDEVKHGFIAKAKKDSITMSSGEIFVFAMYAERDCKCMIDKFESYQ